MKFSQIKKWPSSIKNTWNQFFFEPISPATIGLFRIFFGVVVFLSVLGKYPHREIFYGIDGIVSYETMSHYFPASHPILYFRWMPLEEPWLGYYFLGVLAATLSFIVGYQTRISSILVFLGLVSISNRNFFVDNSGDDLMRINSFFLMFSQAGKAYSVDRWLRIKKGLERATLTPQAPWAQRMLQLQLVYLYIETAILKLPGKGWQNGTAIYYALNYLELRRFHFDFLFSHLWKVKIATYGTLVAEFSAGTLIWFRKLRYWVLLGAFGLHEGINLTMQFPVFQYVMMASLINFIFPEHIEAAMSFLVRKTKKENASLTYKKTA